MGGKDDDGQLGEAVGATLASPGLARQSVWVFDDDLVVIIGIQDERMCKIAHLETRKRRQGIVLFFAEPELTANQKEKKQK